MIADVAQHDQYLHGNLQSDPQPWTEAHTLQPVTSLQILKSLCVFYLLCLSTYTGLKLSQYSVRQLYVCKVSQRVGNCNGVANGVFAGIWSGLDDKYCLKAHKDL